MDYKNTLNLPKTDFPMKGDLPIKEPVMLERWEKQGLYARICERRKAAQKYILHDGPPYANGNIHIGHALNKTLKDIVVKYKTMRGYFAPYVPGWDCHGMPIEHQLFKEIKKTKHDVEQVLFRKMAHKFALKYVEIQKEEFKRLGVFGEWESPYLTLLPSYEKKVIASFNILAKKGFIYRGLKPINWCAKCETALAEAEVEYEDHISPSIYVKFKVKAFSVQLYCSSEHKNLSSRQARRINFYASRELSAFSCQLSAFLVWTTTPWTLLSNVAIAVHPDLEYLIFKTSSGEEMIFAEDRLEELRNKLGLKGTLVTKINGKQLDGSVAIHPFLERDSKVILGDFVSNKEGTGCVHIAPGHGQEDYDAGLKYNLPVVMPVDDRGNFVKLEGYKIPEGIVGKNVFDANKDIIKMLKDKASLLYSEDTQHSYPHCWRCHSPLIFRATKQWFVGVDKNNLRKNTLQEIKKVKWIPDVGENRIYSMIELRPDWCLSRQRYWGVPIPIIYCSSCDREVIDDRLMKNIEDIFGKEGSDVWFLKAVTDYLPKGYKCEKCGGGSFKKETDILDVWFESGASHQGVLRAHKDLNFPADLYLEGSDQHRGWFHTSLLVGMGVEGVSPFKRVLTHGFVVDGEGKKMSKSAGNVIAPQEVISKKGADVLRLWASSSSYFDDIKISDEILERTVDSYRKFRNTAKFLLGNIYDFDPGKDDVPKDEMLEIDRFALSRVNSLLEEVTGSYERFLYHEAVSSIYKFTVIDMSSFYLDILKDRLYTFAKKSNGRRSAQTALYKILDILVRVLAPILPFTAEEIWSHFKKDHSSVHLSDWPIVDTNAIDVELEKRWAKLLELRDEVLKCLEEKRASKIIGSPLQAKIILYIKDDLEYNFLTKYLKDLPYIFIVSQVELKKTEHRQIEVTKADGKKCSRCWNYSDSVGSDIGHPELCERCLNVIVSEGR